MENDVRTAHAQDGNVPERAALLASLLASTNDLVWCTSLDGKELLYLNAAAEATYGHPHADFLKNPNLWLELIHPDDRDSVEENLKRLPHQRQIEQEYRILRADGGIRWLRDCVTVICDDDGKPYCIGGIATDFSRQKEVEEQLSQSNLRMQAQVAERKQAEEALRDSEALYHSLVDNLPIYVTRTDLEGRITFVNNNYCQLVNMTADQLLGRTNRDLHPDEYAEKYRQDELHVIETGEVFMDIEENRRGDQVRYYEVRKSPVRDDHGNVVQVQAVFWDVTERHHAELKRQEAEAAMREAKEAAESANRAKSEFLANMSHEIRTPMNAIIGMTELLLDGRLDSSQRESLQIVCDSAESLLSIINDILDFSKIEAQKLELTPAEFDLHDSLGDAMKSIASRAHGKNVELAYQIEQDVPNHLIGDAGRLRQIVVNLVGNAIKFTEQGEVLLSATLEERQDDTVTLRFSVSDTGIGIQQEQLGTIFAAFEQADSSLTRQYGGTGLGLAISSRLVELMNGRIWAESDFGQGSTFHFTAEFEEVSEPAHKTPALDPQALEGLRAVVVDDNATNRRILKELLLSRGMQPEMASGGEEALEILDHLQREGHDVPLILTDIHMPGIDGYTFSQRVKQQSAFQKTTIIALTSGERPADGPKAAEIGIAAQLSKPVKRDELIQSILVELALVPAEPVEEVDPAVSELANIRPLQILLAEDSYANQKLAVGLLEKWGHDITVANNGREALAAFESRPFDLILMDVQMPEMDGFEATAGIRLREEQSPETERIPIVAMTAHAMKGDRDKCLAAGMDGYVAKPIRIPLLYKAIAEFFPEDAGNNVGIETHSAPGNGEDGRQHCCVDWTAALKAVQGDHDLLRDVASASLEECRTLLPQLERALQDQDSGTARRAAHTIKGLFRMFPYAPASQLALQIENSAEAGNLTGLESACASLRQEMQTVGAEIDEFLRNGEIPNGN